MHDRPTTRREFIATAALGAAGARWQLQGHRPLGVALVGLGSLSTNQLAPALQKTAHCRLAGIVTGTPAKAARWKAQHNLPDRSIYGYDTMHRMADNPDIDIVFIVTPNAQHAEQTILAAKAGKHVLCEKPMEVSVERCEAMIAACRAANRQLAIGYRCQFEPHHLECVRLAREKTFGAVKLIEAGFGFSIGDPRQWRLDRALAGGGPLMDVGVYALQTARMITGEEPVRVTAIETKTDPVKFKEVEESMTFDLEFPSGVLASCRTTYRASGVNRFSVYAERGAFGMEPAYNYGGTRGWRSDRQPLQFDPIDPFAAEMDDFAQCVRAGRPSKVSGEEGLRDVRAMMAIYQAARTGRAVALAEVQPRRP
jgi:predicted dehydrogenase